MFEDVLTTIIWLLPLVLPLIGLAIAVGTDPYIHREHKIIMLINLLLIFSMTMQNYLDYYFDFAGNMPVERTIAGIYGYIVRPMVIVLFFYIVRRKGQYWPAWVLVGVNAAVHLTALFSGICFRIDEENHFQRGPLGFTCHIISGILLVYLIYLTVREFSHSGRKETWIPMFNALLIVIAVIMDSIVWVDKYPTTFLTIAVVSCGIFYYIWLHLQFVRRHESALMAEQRIQIMMTQIQPHFLYNTLTTIQALCRIDPEKAFETTGKFGVYLRQNIDSLSQPDLISINKELEHTKVYADIEMIRFPNITVEYELEDTDFELPALTVQPIVENAIRHGVRIREHGIVKVITRRIPGHHEIVIDDNGKGFDTLGGAAEHTGTTHIGLGNVRERVERMCNGTVSIESVIDEGTTVTIRLPAVDKKATEKD